MNTSEKTGHLVKAYAQFAANVIPLPADQDGAYGKFLSLGRIMSQTQGDLISNGLIVIQGVGSDDEGVTVTSRLIHVESNEWVECEYKMRPERSGPQAQGAIITYGRRYSLMTLLGLSVDQGEDIDTQQDTAAVSQLKRPTRSQPASNGKDAVTIRSVSTSQGEGKSGPWTRWRIETSDGRDASTFDDQVGAAAESAHAQDAIVIVTTHPSKNPAYLDVVEIREAPADVL